MSFILRGCKRKFYFAALFALASACVFCGTAFAGTVFTGTEPADLTGGLSVRSLDFYPQGANFVFQGRADGRFEFFLPGAFDQASVRCQTREKLASLKVETVPVKPAESLELQNLLQKEEEARRAVSLLEARQTALSEALRMLQSPVAWEGKNSQKFDGKMWIGYVTDAQALHFNAGTELAEVNIALKKAREDWDKAHGETETLRQELESKKPANALTAIRIAGATDGPAELLFEAHTPYTGWSVEYDMDLNSVTGDIQVKMSAVVWQRTGMDLDGSVLFHTRQPSPAAALPEVRPLTVGLRSVHPVEPRMKRSSNMMEEQMDEAMYKEEVVYPMAMAAPAPVPEPEVISTLSDVALKGVGKIDGDGTAGRAALGEFGLKSAPLLIAVPDWSREAWIVASLDSVPETLLPGSAELAVDGSYTGRARVSDALAGRLTFGMASRLTVKKVPYVVKTGNSWIGTGILNDGYKLEITNGWDVEREVTVLDRIPIPTADKIALEVTKIDPAPAIRDPENRLTWKIGVKPGETRSVIVEYTLRYPGSESLEYR